MAIASPSSRQAGSLRRRAPLWITGYAGLAAIVAYWTVRALHDARPYDTGLAYQAGQLGWATGHPEHLSTWNGMTFLLGTMAFASRLFSQHTTAQLVTLLNFGCGVVAGGITLHRLRARLRPIPWWILAFTLASFAPLMSSVWWKQFNLIALVLGLGGFELMRRGRGGWGAFALGLSVSIKPLLLLLPVVLLARRATRRLGALALAWIALLNIAAQALMAWRAHDLATLDPTIGIRNFIDKTEPSNLFDCAANNFAPGSLLCRAVGGAQHWSVQRLVVGAAVLLLGIWVIEALRGKSALSWEVFAFTCPLSVMLSPLEWTHYEIVLAPLFVLLFVRFTRTGASPGAWIGLIVAFVLASLMWAPYGSIVGALDQLASGGPDSQQQLSLLEGIAQFAQYILMLTGILWYVRRDSIRAP